MKPLLTPPASKTAPPDATCLVVPVPLTVAVISAETAALYAALPVLLIASAMLSASFSAKVPDAPPPSVARVIWITFGDATANVSGWFAAGPGSKISTEIKLPRTPGLAAV